MAEPTGYTLNVYAKGDLTKPVATGTDTEGAIITGLEAGATVAEGDYVASHTDATGKELESEKVAVPGFEVPKRQAPAPTNVVATPKDDGAVITAGQTA